jgi:thymidylate kinase
MVVLFDGLDNTGKTTQIQKLVSYFANKDAITTVCKYSKFDKLDKTKEEKFSKRFYKDYFEKISNWPDKVTSDPAYVDDNNLVLDRGHISEAVYASMYRTYSGDYVWDLEKCLADKLNTYLIILVDTVEKAVEREDGLSLSNGDAGKISEELAKFIEAYKKSCIPNKILININGFSIEEVFAQIVKFLGI